MRTLPVLACCVILSACAGQVSRTETAQGLPSSAADKASDKLDSIPVTGSWTLSESFEAAMSESVEDTDIGGEEPFDPGCDLPYPLPGPETEVDRVCSASGNHLAGPVADEYRAKNNLCADEPPTLLSLNDFSRLQAAANDGEIPSGSAGATIEDRSVLHSLISAKGRRIGEGSLVQVFGYVREVPKTYDSNSSGGEGVNCHQSNREGNDFHANITRDRGGDPCEGIVVEFIPHFRPDKWQSKVVRALIGGPKVRVTGALFFDAKHSVDSCPRQGQPKRFSLWEVHPIYKFEVCINDDDSKCRISNDADWTTLETLLE